MKPKKKKNELFKVGIVGLLALLLLFFGYNFLKGLNLFEKNNIYFVNLINAKDVSVSTPILIDGYRVGLVRHIEYDYESFSGTLATMAIDKNLKIPKGSFVTVRGNPISGAELAIVKSKNTRSFYQSNDTLISKTNADLIAQVSDDIMPSLVKMINKIDTLMAGLEMIINNKYIFSTFEQISFASDNIKKSSESLKLMMSEQLPEVIVDLKAGVGSIANVANKLDSADITGSVNKLDSALLDINAVTRKLNSPDNTIGLLLNDKALYNKLNNAAGSIDSLVVDIQKNPSRYVRFSLF